MKDIASEKKAVDFAKGKNVMEFCNHPKSLTAEGDDLTYDSIRGGYLGIHHPAFITIDLEDVVEVKQLSIKLFDVDDNCNESEGKTKAKHEICKSCDKIKSNVYAYRLLCSEDKHTWTVLYDTTKMQEDYGDEQHNRLKVYRKGWQWAVFQTPMKMKYFRIHALHNPANSGFHVVRVRLFDRENTALQLGDCLTLPQDFELEVGDAIPISMRLLNLKQRLSTTIPESIKKGSLRYRQIDEMVVENSMNLEQVDGKIEQVRKIVTPHIVTAIESDYKDNSKNAVVGWGTTISIIVLNLVVNRFFPKSHQSILLLVSLIALAVTFGSAWPWIKYAFINPICLLVSRIWFFMKKLWQRLFGNKEDSLLETTSENLLSNNAEVVNCAHIKHNDCIKQFSEDVNIEFSKVLPDDVPYYDTKKGYLSVKNPGWLEIHLKEPKEISYLRFLLWDNCGSEKKQPSNRKYNYRLLVADCLPSGSSSIQWEAVYDNSKNPSNGWQEFFFESGARRIQAIKLQFFHTLSLSTNEDTWLVAIQAYKYPTKAISELSNISFQLYAPPINGFSKSRIIIGGADTQFGLISENQITNEIKDYLKQIENDAVINEEERKNIHRFQSDMNENTQEDLSKQINVLCNSIIEPINHQRREFHYKALWIPFFSNLLLSIDIFPLDAGWKPYLMMAVIAMGVMYCICDQCFKKKPMTSIRRNPA